MTAAKCSEYYTDVFRASDYPLNKVLSKSEMWGVNSPLWCVHLSLNVPIDISQLLLDS